MNIECNGANITWGNIIVKNVYICIWSRCTRADIKTVSFRPINPICWYCNKIFTWMTKDRNVVKYFCFFLQMYYMAIWSFGGLSWRRNKLILIRFGTLMNWGMKKFKMETSLDASTIDCLQFILMMLFLAPKIFRNSRSKQNLRM